MTERGLNSVHEDLPKINKKVYKDLSINGKRKEHFWERNNYEWLINIRKKSIFLITRTNLKLYIISFSF